nr:hypothetical protein CFP56_00638 [Quercus suber]
MLSWPRRPSPMLPSHTPRLYCIPDCSRVLCNSDRDHFDMARIKALAIDDVDRRLYCDMHVRDGRTQWRLRTIWTNAYFRYALTTKWGHGTHSKEVATRLGLGIFEVVRASHDRGGTEKRTMRMLCGLYELMLMWLAEKKRKKMQDGMVDGEANDRIPRTPEWMDTGEQACRFIRKAARARGKSIAASALQAIRKPGPIVMCWRPFRPEDVEDRDMESMNSAGHKKI